LRCVIDNGNSAGRQPVCEHEEHETHAFVGAVCRMTRIGFNDRRRPSVNGTNSSESTNSLAGLTRRPIFVAFPKSTL